MSQVIEESHAEDSQAEKGQPKVVKAAAMGMALMGSSLAASDGGHHIDHGYAPARWTAAAISIVGWLVGCVGFFTHSRSLLITFLAVGLALNIVAIVVNLAMNAAGLGAKANDRWAAAKAEAQAARG